MAKIHVVVVSFCDPQTCKMLMFDMLKLSVWSHCSVLRCDFVRARKGSCFVSVFHKQLENVPNSPFIKVIERFCTYKCFILVNSLVRFFFNRAKRLYFRDR